MIRRDIEELATLYELEPEIRDVFVEGPCDKIFYEWYLNRHNANFSSIFEIDCVNIPNTIIQKYSLDNNKRGRVISLAYELETRLANIPKKNSILAIADSDYDYFLDVTNNCELLLLTDYTSLELYLFNENVIGKFLSIVLMNTSEAPDILMNKFIPILQKLFVIRMANKKLGWGMKWLSFDRTCKLLDGEIIFSESEFIRRYLLKNGCIKNYKQFNSEVAQLSKKFKPECRYQIRGHDFISLLRWYLIKSIGLKDSIKNDKVCERSIFGCIELTDIDDEGLFKNLLCRFS